MNRQDAKNAKKKKESKQQMNEDSPNNCRATLLLSFALFFSLFLSCFPLTFLASWRFIRLADRLHIFADFSRFTLSISVFSL
jgi:hypothetical protein